jgi:hypothetical protein
MIRVLSAVLLVVVRLMIEKGAWTTWGSAGAVGGPLHLPECSCIMRAGASPAKEERP